MNKLIISFFGEEVTINTPRTLEYLKKEIASKFCFSPSDAAEILISYFTDLKKIFIKTEQDFMDFVKKKIYKVDLDISQESQLYKKSMQKLLEENDKDKDKKKLEEILTLNEELEKKKDTYIKAKEIEIKKLEEEIKFITQQKNNLIKETNKEKEKISKEIRDNELKINSLRKKLGIPLKQEKKIEQINKKNTPLNIRKFKCGNLEINKSKKVYKVHTGIYCNGCGANSIVGYRFKCAICPNFDYCQKCEELNKDKHPHPFIKIYSPQTAPIDIKCDLNKI